MLLFLVLVACAVLFEIRWLVSNGWTESGRASAFVVVTDIIGLLLGTFIVLTVFIVMFMMVMGPAGTGSNVPDAVYFANALVAIIVPPVLLMLCKRVFLSVFKIKAGKPAWIYSLVASLSILAVTLIPPPVIFYLLDYTGIWK